MIRIRSKRHLFRRCGMPHPKKPVDYPDDRFSEEEIERLKAETMLIVEVIPDGTEEQTASSETEEPPEPAQQSDQTVATEPSREKEDQLTIETETVTPVVDFNEWTVKQLTELLEKRGIEIPKKALKAELIDLIKTG